MFFTFFLLAAATQRAEVVPLPLIQDATTDAWGPCRACGTGVSTQKTQCATNDGCLTDTQYRSCFITECPSNTSTFRDLQCAAFNTVGPSQTQYTWASVQSNSCQLTCAQRGGSGVLTVLAADGTDCLTTSGDQGVCAGGRCMMTGCDGILGSGKVVDECNRCLDHNGDDGRCVRFFGSIGGPHSKQPVNSTGYVLPAGASSINVTHIKKPHDKGLALSSALGGRWYIVSNYTSGDIEAMFGVTVHYEFRQELTFDVQTLLIQGPLPNDITVQVLPNNTNSTGSVSYYMLANQTDSTSSGVVEGEEIPGLGWRYGAFSACSASCGLGVETAVAVCSDVEYPDNTVPDYLCNFLAHSRPLPMMRWCSMGSCLPTWKPLTWGACSASCGGGIQTRPLQCVQTQADGTELVVNATSCPSAGMPTQKKSCNSRPCQPHWEAGNWGPCSTTCGSGIRTRAVLCVDINGQEVNSVYCENDENPAPLSTTQCINTQPCCSWAAQDWGPCTGVCGSMYTYRTVLCLCEGNGVLYQGTGCSNSSRPQNVQKCQQTNCPTWQTGAWGPCSATCGPGISRREVICMNGNRTAVGCDITTQPSSVTVCQANKPCCTTCAPDCIDIAGVNCPFVQQLQQCNGYYQHACCKTCSGCCST